MRVLFVTSEAYPLAETGGLGGVARALPQALTEQGVDTCLLLPGYPSALDNLIGGRVEATLDGVMGVPVGRLISGQLPGSGIPSGPGPSSPSSVKATPIWKPDSPRRALCPDNVAIRIGYEEPLAHRLYAGADMLLAPARFEPCGLTQLYAMRYGTPPVVRRTGGLADTVVNADRRSLARRTATGFSFDDPTLAAMTDAVERAVEVYRQPLAWRRLQLQAMAQDFSWEASAAKYLSLYSAVTGVSAPTSEAAPSHDAAQSIEARRAGGSAASAPWFREGAVISATQ